MSINPSIPIIPQWLQYLNEEGPKKYNESISKDCTTLQQINKLLEMGYDPEETIKWTRNEAKARIRSERVGEP